MKKPLVSIIIRTCNRPHILKNALESIRQQTYKNLEAIVVEDGEEHASEIIHWYQNYFTIKYYSTGTHVGRTQAGNLGLEKASGDFFNFLDDDDILYPNHIELLVNTLRHSSNKIAYSIANECIIKKISKDPYFKIIRTKVRYQQCFNRILLCNKNYLPIQCVLFSRDLYDSLGGFDPLLDQLEDWDLWVRYSTKTDFTYLPLITSEYRVPWDLNKRLKREKGFFTAYETVKLKFKTYKFYQDAFSVNCEVEYLLSVYTASFLRKQWRMLKKHFLSLP